MTSTGNACFTFQPPSFSPDQIEGLFSWYNLSSVKTDSFSNVIQWNDISGYQNHLVPYLCNTTVVGPINSPTGIYFSNSVMRNSNTLNLGNITSGASVFIVADVIGTPPYTTIQTYLSLFLSNTSNKTIISPPGSNGLTISSVPSVNINTNHTLYTYNLDKFSLDYQTELYNYDYGQKLVMTGLYLNKIYSYTTGSQQYPLQYTTYEIDTISCIGNTVSGISRLNTTLTTDKNYFNLFVGDNSNFQNIDGCNAYHGINGNIYEILIYNRVLDNDTIGKLNSYLCGKNNATPLNSIIAPDIQPI